MENRRQKRKRDSEAERLYHVEIVEADRTHVPATILMKEIDDKAHLTLQSETDEITKVTGYAFHAMCRIREELEQTGRLLYCYGASRNIMPSGMSLSMSGGVLVYKIVLGQEAKDIVNIFDIAPGIEPATVSQQEAYRDEWIRSIRRLRRSGLDTVDVNENS